MNAWTYPLPSIQLHVDGNNMSHAVASAASMLYGVADLSKGWCYLATSKHHVVVRQLACHMQGHKLALFFGQCTCAVACPHLSSTCSHRTLIDKAQLLVKLHWTMHSWACCAARPTDTHRAWHVTITSWLAVQVLLQWMGCFWGS